MNQLALLGYDLFGEPVNPEPSCIVAKKFIIPPFSVLDARSGEWQDRKRAWIRLGIQGEVGRKKDLTYTGAASTYDHYRIKEKEKLGRKEGLTYMKAESAPDYWKDKMGDSWTSKDTGTSIFDPTLCECIYRWFTSPNAQIIDPFAGGSVRGIVAGMLGRRYWGCDLSGEQINANNNQADFIKPEIRPKWVCGDAIKKLEEAPEADLVFSCPPYGDLEKYSDNPDDLSNMEWHTFSAAYSRIILRSIKKLKNNRFACFVVGDFRDKKGFYRDFVSKTIEAFRTVGSQLYNEAILITPVGSASMRITKQFNSGRKFAKTHQNVLVFCKGDWRKAVADCKDF